MFLIEFQLTIYTDDMELAGDIIQSLAQFFNIEHLLTSADFPLVINSLKETLKKVCMAYYLNGCSSFWQIRRAFYIVCSHGRRGPNGFSGHSFPDLVLLLLDHIF